MKCGGPKIGNIDGPKETVNYGGIYWHLFLVISKVGSFLNQNSRAAAVFFLTSMDPEVSDLLFVPGDLQRATGLKLVGVGVMFPPVSPCFHRKKMQTCTERSKKHDVPLAT